MLWKSGPWSYIFFHRLPHWHCSFATLNCLLCVAALLGNYSLTCLPFSFLTFFLSKYDQVNWSYVTVSSCSAKKELVVYEVSSSCAKRWRHSMAHKVTLIRFLTMTQTVRIDRFDFMDLTAPCAKSCYGRLSRDVRSTWKSTLLRGTWRRGSGTCW